MRLTTSRILPIAGSFSNASLRSKRVHYIGKKWTLLSTFQSCFLYSLLCPLFPEKKSNFSLRPCSRTQHASVMHKAGHTCSQRECELSQDTSHASHLQRCLLAVGVVIGPRRLVPPPQEPGAREPAITRLAQQRHGFMRT